MPDEFFVTALGKGGSSRMENEGMITSRYTTIRSEMLKLKKLQYIRISSISSRESSLVVSPMQPLKN
jgi:hypothetical protein